jgi:hypothetical protein
VLASRMPALLAALFSLVTVISDDGAGIDMITPLTQIMCYMLWIRADLFFFVSKS